MFAWITGLVAAGGAWAVFALMALENVFPALPSELILPMAGYQAARGVLSFPTALLAATAGSVLGAVPLYWIARWLGYERLTAWAAQHGRWLTLSPDEIERGRRWFARWGFWAVLIGRTLPGVRGIVCIPAGLARQPFGRFLLALSLGSLSWSALILAAGYLLRSHFDRVETWLNPVTTAFATFCALVYVYRVLTFGRRR